MDMCTILFGVMEKLQSLMYKNYFVNLPKQKKID